MSTKVAVTNDDFTVDLPCEMLVRDAVDQGWTQKTITGYIGSGYDFPWRSCDEMYKYAKPIEEPKMIPWTIADFTIGTIVRDTDTTELLASITAVDMGQWEVRVSGQWYSLDNMNTEFTQANGHKFQKESN